MDFRETVESFLVARGGFYSINEEIIRKFVLEQPEDSTFEDKWKGLIDHLSSYALDNTDYALIAGEMEMMTFELMDFTELTWRLKDQLTDAYLQKVEAHPELDGLAKNTRKFNIIALRTLIHGGYLLSSGKYRETPAQMYLRIAVHLTPLTTNFLAEVEQYFLLLLHGRISHATPTMMNSGTKLGQLASCFILSTPKTEKAEDVIGVLMQATKISSMSGGIGVSGHTIRDIVKYAKLLNSTSQMFDQNGKRPAVYNLYLEPWHPDIERFLELKNPVGNEDLRARDLFYTLWIPDIFMKRLENKQKWSLMPVNQGLEKLYGEEFEKLYCSLEQRGEGKEVDIENLFLKILKSLQESGGPSIMFKDTVNRLSNHRSLGTIAGGNLCTEVVQYSDSQQTAVCNLASLSLPAHITEEKMNFALLEESTSMLVNALNEAIDVNVYPDEKTKEANIRQRPIGIGAQGLADVFMILKIPFESEEARMLNRKIFEVIYFSALKASLRLNMKNYRTGGNQFEACEVIAERIEVICDGGFYGAKTKEEWWELREEILSKGLKNSMLTTIMPTASTAHILGNIESIEPITSNIIIRSLSSGHFQVLNPHMFKNIQWDEKTKQQVLKDRGSLKNLNVNENIKEVFKTSWEMKMKPLLLMASDRQKFIDQSQSMNVFFSDPKVSALSSLIMDAWKLGLKTAIYYLRTRPARDPIQFTIKHADVIQDKKEVYICSRANKDCAVCSA